MSGENMSSMAKAISQGAALAMITSELIPEPSKSYVVHGALVECSHGSRPGLLIVPISHGVYLKNKAQLNYEDGVGIVNIQSMGVCSAGESALYPDKEEREKKGFLETCSDFFFGKKSDEELEEIATETIKVCDPSTCGKWSNAKDNTYIGRGYERALLSNSTISCIKGGTITINNDGQEIMDHIAAITEDKSLLKKNKESVDIGQMAIDAVGLLIEPLIEYGDEFLNNLLLSNGKAGTTEQGAKFLMMDKDENGVYHVRQDCWQQFVGYHPIYDVGFDIGTDMVPVKFPFVYNEEKYVFWGWKGDYINMGAGAELGIYAQEGTNGVDLPGENFWLVDRDLSMPMTMEVRTKDGDLVANYEPEDPQWWITSFNPEYKDVKAEDLTVNFTVDFSQSSESRAMYKEFWDQIEASKDTENDMTPYWQKTDDDFTLKLTF